jgi:methylthioribose-1-phosphate isomerase
MVGYIMSKRIANKVIVGADRIVRDGVINKIGTYTIALVAHEHNIPFYVAAPKSTFDLKSTSKDVIIEERTTEEVTHLNNVRIAPKGVDALNPAFDITPFKLVSAIICETGVLSPSKLFVNRL